MTDQRLLYLFQADVRGEHIAAAAEQIDQDLKAEFKRRYIESVDLPGSKQA